MLRSVALSATVGLAVGQLGIPSVCPYPITYDMAKSTIIMVRACSRSACLCPGQRRHLRATPHPPCLLRTPLCPQPCNESGLTDPQSTVGWGIIDFDWSNAKVRALRAKQPLPLSAAFAQPCAPTTQTEWAKAKPMNCEEMLVEQVKVTTEASPGTTVWVYRNGIKALPWYTLVREKVTDPKYAKWFMRFSPEAIANKTTDPAMHAKMCDSNYSPPRCSELYHDHAQTPGYPKGDGDCAPPGCDVGSVPIGEYLFDPRAANVSIDGQTFAEWYVDDYLFGPTGAGNPNISGFYFDDHWTMSGPSEVRKRLFCAIFAPKTRLGTNMGKVNQKKVAFSCRWTATQPRTWACQTRTSRTS